MSTFFFVFQRHALLFLAPSSLFKQFIFACLIFPTDFFSLSQSWYLPFFIHENSFSVSSLYDLKKFSNNYKEKACFYF